MYTTTKSPTHRHRSPLALEQQDRILDCVHRYARMQWNMDPQDLMATMGACPPDYCTTTSAPHGRLMPRSMQLALLEVLGVFTAIQDTPHPTIHDRAWLLQSTQTFGGAAPIDLFLERGLRGIRQVRLYLRSRAIIPPAKAPPLTGWQVQEATPVSGVSSATHTAAPVCLAQQRGKEQTP